MTNAGKIEEAIGKHTPLPWYIRRGYDTNDAVGIGAHSKGPAGGWVGLHVADLPTGDAANANANAALIVRAVNAHEGLIKALEKIIRPHDCGCQPCTGQCESEEAAKIWKENTIEIARAALKQSEGTQVAPVAAHVPAEVRRLVIAARVVAFESQSKEALKELDTASEAFADRVPWENQP